MSFVVTFFFMFFHYGSRGDFLGAVPVTPGALRAFLDMLVLSLFFCAHAAKMFFSRHPFPFLGNYSVSLLSRLSHLRSPVISPQYGKRLSVSSVNPTWRLAFLRVVIFCFFLLLRTALLAE